LVTTNFDHLFERDRKLTTHVAPILPDLAITGSFEGIVYLHGRRSTGRHAVQRRLVLASADFGRAYLAEGWATRFVRDLLERYVIVLLGYSASDPPVRYLLEGLNSKRTASAATIYAFDHGGADEVLNRWRGRGVTALPYSRLPDVGHAPLWNSLRAWADRALDVDTWRKSIVRLARLGPANIASHERGQVASLVRTAEGAAVFARAADPPPAEWLCVFDRNVRCADFRNGRDEIDPLTLFGLDDDPSRAELDADRSANVKEPRGDDLIGMGPNDNRTDTHKRIAGVSTRHGDVLPPRLWSLAVWFGKVADAPTAIWWVCGYSAVHPQLLHQVEWRLQTAHNLSPLGTRAWRLLLERFRHSPGHSTDDGWFAFICHLKNEGWTSHVLRDFARAATPYVLANRPSSARLQPPPEITQVDRLGWVVDFEVHFPGYDREKVEVTAAALPALFEICRRGLETAADLLSEIGREYWRTASFIAGEDNKENGRRYLDDPSKYLLWVVEMFDRLASENPTRASAETRGWRIDEPYFFDKLRLHAWAKSTLLSGKETGDSFVALTDEAF
jgi:hypothetical protein